MLTISLINKEQSEQFASLPVGTAAPPTIPPQQELDTPNAATQAAMVTTFASQSGMNEHFSAMYGLFLVVERFSFDKFLVCIKKLDLYLIQIS